MVFGGGEFLMELIETITDLPGFDSAWVDFCKYYNASNVEYVRSAFDCSLKRLGYEAFSVNLGMLFGGQNPNPMLKNFGMHVRPCSHP